MARASATYNIPLIFGVYSIGIKRINGNIMSNQYANATYPAKEYLTKTRNFHQENNNGVRTNCTEDFTPEKHKLSPMENLNSAYIIQGSSDANKILLSVFATMNQRYLEIFNELIQNLEQIAERLKRRVIDNPNHEIS